MVADSEIFAKRPFRREPKCAESLVVFADPAILQTPERIKMKRLVQRPSNQASGTSGDCDVFSVPKLILKRQLHRPTADVNQWAHVQKRLLSTTAHVQKRLLSTTRAEKLWRYYNGLRTNKWDQCGLCIQLGKSKRIRKRWLLRQAEKDGISID